jgi:hypothetical protein
VLPECDLDLIDSILRPLVLGSPTLSSIPQKLESQMNRIYLNVHCYTQARLSHESTFRYRKRGQS